MRGDKISVLHDSRVQMEYIDQGRQKSIWLSWIESKVPNFEEEIECNNGAHILEHNWWINVYFHDGWIRRRIERNHFSIQESPSLILQFNPLLEFPIPCFTMTTHFPLISPSHLHRFSSLSCLRGNLFLPARRGVGGAALAAVVVGAAIGVAVIIRSVARDGESSAWSYRRESLSGYNQRVGVMVRVRGAGTIVARAVVVALED